MQTQQNTGRYGREIRALLSVAGPLIVNNLSIAGMQFADAVMAGRLGAESLAAVAVGGSVWFLGFTLALGTLMAVGIMILPAAAARFWAGSIGGLIIAAVAVAILSSLSGLLLSFYFSLPSGPAIILVAGIAYVASLVFGPVAGLASRALPRPNFAS